MNVATALNRKYVRYTGVMLYSLALNNPRHIDAYLLHSELTDEDIDYIASCVKDFDVALHPLAVDRKKFSDRLPRNDQWSLETYYRLLLLDILPETVERLLYLDVDLIVNQSLDAFYDMPLDDYELVACADASGKSSPTSYGHKHQEMFAPMVEKGYVYFCAGVILFHIALLRKKYNFQTYLDAIVAWDYAMEAPDQDLLNWVHWERVGYVDERKYNMFARIAHNDHMSYDDVKKNCAILHFAGDKPWASTNVHYDVERLWWDYAEKTPAYETLLRDFLDSSLTDYGRVETYIYQLEDQNRQLQTALQQATAMLKKMQS